MSGMVPYSKNVSYIVAKREGLFEREGLTVCYNQVRSSNQQWDDLRAGRYDIVSAASDNAVTRVVNSGLPVSIVAGLEMNNDQVLAVNTARGINTFEDLRGKPIAVDAPDTGFSFLLRKILAEHGLFLENGDYSLQPIGGVALGYAALQAGQTATGQPVYASMINYPFAAQLHEPVAVLARAEEYVFPYQGGAFAVRHDYSASHPETITSFLRAIILMAASSHAACRTARRSSHTSPPSSASPRKRPRANWTRRSTAGRARTTRPNSTSRL